MCSPPHIQPSSLEASNQPVPVYPYHGDKTAKTTSNRAQPDSCSSNSINHSLPTLPRKALVSQSSNSPLQVLAETLELLQGFLSNLENLVLQKEVHDVSTDFFWTPGNTGLPVSFQGTSSSKTKQNKTSSEKEMAANANTTSWGANRENPHI